jgi:ABC-type glycerol-3-phosphate transport system substrate-binding protein
MTRISPPSGLRLNRRGLLAGTTASLGLLGTSVQAAAPTRIGFSGWAFEPQVTEANVKLFMQQNPDITVDYAPIDMQSYNQKMIAQFNANAQADAFYVRDTDLGAWVEAGWLLPIDGMPGLDALDDDIFPFNRQALSYGGKQYGTPYYGDISVYIYDKAALAKAGIAQPPVTLEQLKNTALELKKAGIAEYPILKGYKTNVDGRFPGLQDVGKGPMGWTRLYGISATSKQPAASWRLISFMGGKDKTGAYVTAKDWYLRYGVGYAFKSMDHDPDIVAAQKAAGYDLDVRSQQYGSAQARDNVGASWYSDWDRFTQQQIQNVLLGQTKPLQALQASADKARALKKNG